MEVILFWIYLSRTVELILFSLPCPSIWLLGHLVPRPGGWNLGFHKVDAFWRGIRGLRWSHVLPEEISRSAHPSPVILVNYAGGNDLFYLQLAELLKLMRSDLHRIAGYFAEVVLVWSKVIPWVTWQGARDAGVVERVHKAFDVRISRFIQSGLAW